MRIRFKSQRISLVDAFPVRSLLDLGVRKGDLDEFFVDLLVVHDSQDLHAVFDRVELEQEHPEPLGVAFELSHPGGLMKLCDELEQDQGSHRIGDTRDVEER